MASVEDLKNVIYFPIVLTVDDDGAKTIIPPNKWNQLKKSVPIPAGKSVAVRSGEVSGISVIDIDRKDRGLEIFQMMCGKFGCELYNTNPYVKTVNGGLHWWFPYNPNLKTGSKLVKLLNDDGTIEHIGIDVRNDNAMIICPPTPNYKWKNRLDEYELKPAPEWLIKSLTTPIKIIDGSVCFVDNLDLIKMNIPVINNDQINPLVGDHTKRELVIEILNNLSIQRCNSYEDWINVCLAIGGISKKYDFELLNELIEWSKNSSKFDMSCVNKIENAYNSSNGSFGIGSLWYWLKLDNPVKFNEMVNTCKSQENTEWYFDDYCKLIEIQNRDDCIDFDIVKDYLKSVYVKVNCCGNPRYFCKGKQNGYPIWTETLPNKHTLKIKKSSKDKLFPIHCLFDEMDNCGQITTYSYIDFVPYLKKEQMPSSEVFNIFKPFPFEYVYDYTDTMKNNDLKLIQNILHHIKVYICDDKEVICNYCVNYLKHLIQYPNNKPETAMIVIGDMGLGKDAIFNDLMTHILGVWNVNRVDGIKGLLRKFNSSQEGKLLTIISEIRDTENSSVNDDKLKAIITNKTVNIEPKGKDPYAVQDKRRFIGFGNNKQCLNIDPKDRRYFVWRSYAKIETQTYFTKLFNDINDVNVQQAFFNFLSHDTLASWNPRIIPSTDFKVELQRNTYHNVYRFIIDYVNENLMYSDTQEKIIDTKTLFLEYTNWATENKERMASNKKNFVLKLNELGLVETRHVLNGTKPMCFKLSRESIIYELKTKLNYEFDKIED